MESGDLLQQPTYSRYSFLVMSKEEISKKGVVETAIGYLMRKVGDCEL